MSKGRGSKKRGKPQRRHNSALKDHQHQKKVLTPPMMQIQKLVMTSWVHVGLPECIWIAAVGKDVGRRAAAHGPLDILEPLAETAEGRELLDGRISNFSLIPEDRRAAARKELRERAPYALPEGLGHALYLYPECPAFWLYEDWLAENEPDREQGIAYSQELVAPMIPARDPHSAQLRLMVLFRHAKAGKLQMTRDIETADLLDKYPTYLDADARARVESFARATWNTLSGFDLEGQPASPSPWSKYFWRRGYEISDCEMSAEEIELDGIDEDDLPSEESGVSDDEPTIAEMRVRFASAIDRLGSELRELQTSATLDTFSSEVDEVKLGLASRAFRLLRHFLSTPFWWTNEMAPHLIRSMVDERIIVAWLLKQNDPDEYVKFKEYGRGKRKLFKLKLEEVMDGEDSDGADDVDIKGLHARLEDEVNEDTMEEFLKIDLGGTFSGKNIRKMAQETDLADLYSLSYQPLSTESHGEWGSLIMFDLGHCGNPLHLYHRLGRFDTDEQSYLHLGWARTASDLTEEIITAIFTSIGLDAEPAFVRFHERIAAGRETPESSSAGS